NLNLQKKRKKIDRPESIPEDSWQHFYDLGRHVSDFVMDAFEVHESGDYANWDKNRVKDIESSLKKKNEAKIRYGRNLVCEYVLVERMKEKEFFCCDLSQMILFNYKHALIHFTSHDHHEKENEAARNSGVDCVQRVLDLFTGLPKKLFENDVKNEQIRMKKEGLVDTRLMNNISNMTDTRFRPNHEFLVQWFRNYYMLTSNRFAFTVDPVTGQKRFNVLLAARVVVSRAKGEEGQKAMAELHEHLG
ncbi:hypothetical protein PMAYCL1PPCAC_24996, partial [Pristionchus mayeri]